MADADETVPKKRFERERRARRMAEELLEQKSTELYWANKALMEEKQRVERRSASIEQAHEELTQAHTQLVQSEKMAAIGQLAAGVAHEINNPIAFVRSNMTMLGEYAGTFKHLLSLSLRLQQACQSGDGESSSTLAGTFGEAIEQADVEYLFEDLDDVVAESIEGLDRVREIVSSLKDFSRIEGPTLERVDINEGLRSTLKVISNELKYKCDLDVQLGDIPLTLAQGGKLNQVFMNLLVNAAHSIAEHGIVTIQTSHEHEQVLVRIADNGCGIPEEKLAQIFEPFFTTKPAGVGTGLGLAITQRIIDEHNGTIEVQSTVDVGTAFVITLPVNGVQDEQCGANAA